MKKAIFVLTVLLLFASVAAATDGKSDANAVKSKVQEDKPLLIKGESQDDKWFPIKVKESCITVAISVSAVVVALIAAVGAWRAAHKTQMAAEGGLFFDLIKEYSSHEMRDDLHTVWNWDREEVGTDKLKRDEQAQKWIDQVYNKKIQNAIEIDKARRHITHYFLNILDLEESNYVSEGFAKRICEAVGTAVLDVVFPLEKATIEFIGHKEKWPLDKIEEEVKKLKNRFEKIKTLSSYAPFRR